MQQLRAQLKGKDSFVEAVLDSIPTANLDGKCLTAPELQRVWPIVKHELEVVQYTQAGGGVLSDALGQLVRMLKVQPVTSDPLDTSISKRLTRVSELLLENRFLEAANELESLL